MKKLAIMQPYLFPYLGYFQLINAVDKFVIHDDVTFIKQGWINRNNILSNNNPLLFTIPIKKINSRLLICEAMVSYDFDWKLKILNTIKNSYRKAPYFEEVFQIVENTFLNKESNISKIAIKSLSEVMSYLGLKIDLSESSNSYPKSELRSQEKVLDICKKESAIQYINPIGGQELYSKSDFSQYGIQLNFIKMRPVQYKQFENIFAPNLSIIDVLMFNSPQEVKEMLQQYELI
jgi:signal recognition particle subunit SEC65